MKLMGLSSYSTGAIFCNILDYEIFWTRINEMQGISNVTVVLSKFRIRGELLTGRSTSWRRRWRMWEIESASFWPLNVVTITFGWPFLQFNFGMIKYTVETSLIQRPTRLIVNRKPFSPFNSDEFLTTLSLNHSYHDNILVWCGHAHTHTPTPAYIAEWIENSPHQSAHAQIHDWIIILLQLIALWVFVLLVLTLTIHQQDECGCSTDLWCIHVL